jgi:two-component system uhpT operon response regulator UhpA
MSEAALKFLLRPIPLGPRFVIVDDHPLVREAIASRLLAACGGATIVYSGPSVFEAVREARVNGCDCAIADIDLGGAMGAAEIVTAFSMHGIAVVALTENASVEGLEEVAIAGGKGYVDKRSDPSDMVAATLTILEGNSWAASEFVNRTGRLSSVVSLSEQERRSLVLYASGMTLQMVARRMGIAPSTVKHYLDRVRQKYTDAGRPARTKLELHAIARQEGWLP